MLKRFLVLVLLPLTTLASEGIPSAVEIDSVMRDLAAITGFRVRRQLRFEMVTREQVNHFLNDQIRRSVKPEELRAEETTLKKFGFVPPDFDLKKTTIDLLTEQAAAFYDFHRKKLFISDWATRNMRDEALVHELGHALADQNFPIEKFLGKNSSDAEESLARESVVEGQAEWLTIEYALRRMGKTLADPANAREYLKPEEDSDTADKQYPVFSNSPLYIRSTMMFPYEDGQRFQESVFLKDGRRAFSEVFTKPPTTTAQVMHPDRYFHSVAPTSPELPKPLRRAHPFVGGTVGELDERVLLRQYVDTATAEALAPKLTGGAYRIDETKPKGSTMLVYASEWQDEDAAREYFAAYRKILQGKWKKVEILTENSDRICGKSEDGYFAVTRSGRRILSEEGFATPF
ncbi:MAG TPA: hypothetical protein VKB79_03855 [Bryobacteraceae bacterium]|nr:hypothetical protein [Bryobacteraceae bacterium]